MWVILVYFKDNFAYDSVSGVNIKLKNMPSLYSSKEYIDEVNKVREDLISSLASQQEKMLKIIKMKLYQQ